MILAEIRCCSIWFLTSIPFPVAILLIKCLDSTEITRDFSFTDLLSFFVNPNFKAKIGIIIKYFMTSVTRGIKTKVSLDLGISKTLTS